MEKLLYSVAEVQELTSLGRTKVYELLQTRALESVRVGRAIRIPAKALLEWVAKQQEATQAKVN
jgi:excisionase family DNA binding protein